LSSQATNWAANDTVQNHKGESAQIAIGDYCEDCFEVGVDILGYASVAAFKASHDAEPKVRETTKIVKANRCSPGSAGDVKYNKVMGKVVGFEVEVEKTCRCYTDLHLRNLVDSVRLSKLAMKEIPEVSVPVLSQPGSFQNMYAFPREEKYDAGDEGIDVTMRAKVAYHFETEELGKTKSLYQSHAIDLYRRTTAKALADDGIATVLNRMGMTPLGAFVENYKKSFKRKGTAAPSLSAQDGRSLTGRAAGQYVVQDEDQQNAESLLADLSEQQAAKQETPHGRLHQGR